ESNESAVQRNARELWCRSRERAAAVARASPGSSARPMAKAPTTAATRPRPRVAQRPSVASQTTATITPIELKAVSQTTPAPTNRSIGGLLVGDEVGVGA